MITLKHATKFLDQYAADRCICGKCNPGSPEEKEHHKLMEIALLRIRIIKDTARLKQLTEQ